jgi:hypothetical protein
MQAAFINAAVVKKVAMPSDAKAVGQVVRVADKLRTRAPRENVQLSFRTAQKLKADGTL